MKVFVGFIVLLSCIMVVAGSGAYSFASIQEKPPVEPVRDKLGKVLPVLKEPESKDCQGTVYKKRGVCKNTSGDILDGSEGKCGKGKVSWALDVKDPGYTPEFGPLGKCPNFEELRDCEVPCPKPCEGNTWKKGKCVRRDANGKVTVLDGTKGKCGDGILDLQLDTTATDYKPAVGSGRCITKKEGACFVKCPKPEPPKCSYVSAGWQKNDLGCVTTKTPAADGSYTGVSCGQSGWRQEYRASTLNTEKCDTLTQWVPCKAPPCPIDCVGSWSDWSACELPEGEVCGITKTKSTYRVTREKNSTGKACPNGWYDGKPRDKMCGQSQSVSCCTKGDWENVGDVLSTGKQKQKRTVVGCDPNTPKVREIDDCYMSDWVDRGCVGTDGKRKDTRTVKGTKCDFNTKSERLVKDLAKCSVDCEGYYTDPACPTTCGTAASTVTQNWVTTKQQVGTGAACPPSTKTKSCPATVPCPVDCEGYYTDPACPTACGTAASSLIKKWVTTTSPVGTGAVCPSPSTKSCPATAECMAYKTYYASNIPFEGKPGTFSWIIHDKTLPLNQSAHLCAKKCNSDADCKGFEVGTSRCYLHTNDASKPRNGAGRLYCTHPNVRYNFRKSSTPPNNICTYLYAERKPNPTTHFPRYP